MTRRERTLLIFLAILILFAGALVGWVIFDSAARGRQQNIHSLEAQKEGLINRLELSSEDRQGLEAFVAKYEDALMSAEMGEDSMTLPLARDFSESGKGGGLSDTLSSLLPANGLEIMSFRVSSSDAMIQFEARGPIVNILTSIRDSEDRGIQYETVQISRIGDNAFSWRGTVLEQ